MTAIWVFGQGGGRSVTGSHTEEQSRQEAVDDPGRSSPRFMPALDNTEQDMFLNVLNIPCSVTDLR
jgi:hypothetical protein